MEFILFDHHKFVWDGLNLGTVSIQLMLVYAILQLWKISDKLDEKKKEIKDKGV